MTERKRITFLSENSDEESSSALPDGKLYPHVSALRKGFWEEVHCFIKEVISPPLHYRGIGFVGVEVGRVGILAR